MSSTKFFDVVLAIPVTSNDDCVKYDRLFERQILRRHAVGAGTDHGIRDWAWTYRTLRGATNAVKRIKKALKNRHFKLISADDMPSKLPPKTAFVAAFEIM